MEALVCLAFPLSLKVHVDLQCLSMYYHRDPPDDPLASLSIDLYLLYEISLAETDCFCKDTLMSTRKLSDSMEDTHTFNQIVIITEITFNPLFRSNK